MHQEENATRNDETNLGMVFLPLKKIATEQIKNYLASIVPEIQIKIQLQTIVIDTNDLLAFQIYLYLEQRNSNSNDPCDLEKKTVAVHHLCRLSCRVVAATDDVRANKIDTAIITTKVGNE